MDCGFSVENPMELNRDICVTNKCGVYMLCGNALVLTATQGHSLISKALEQKCIVYNFGDYNSLSAELQKFVDFPDVLYDAKETVLQLGKKRWNWEHHEEKAKLLGLVKKVLGSGS